MRIILVSKLLLFSLTLGMASISIAQESPSLLNERLEDNRISDQRLYNQIERLTIPQPKADTPIVMDRSSSQPPKLVSMSKQELAEHPELIVRALLAAVIQGNTENVTWLYPLYQNVPNQYHDELLEKWASAIIAKHNRDYTQAVKLYRQVITAKSNIMPANLQLAITLFENNEFVAAEDQFKKLRAEPIAQDLHVLIERYLNAISQQDRWTYNASATYLNNPNINNAPNVGTIEQQSGILTAQPRQSAEGVGIHANTKKRWSWNNGYFNTFGLNTQATYYWDNKKYNEASINAQAGLGYQNSKLLASITPFVEQRLYAGGSQDSDTLQRFAKSTGVEVDVNYWLSPQWQVNSSYEYADQHYHTRDHLNGYSHFASTSLAYYPNAQRQLYASLNYNQTLTRDDDDSFTRRGATIGWSQAWDKGVSTSLSLSIAKRQYHGPTPLFGTIQRHEYGAQASIWHRALHYKGVTPRLTYSYQKNSSNHPFYSYDKDQLYLSFSKRF